MDKIDNQKIIGHDRVLAYFERLEKTGSYAHAYIFSGQEHVGKTRVLSLILTQLLGHGVSEEVLDGQSQHLDINIVQALEGKRDISIEQIRQLIDDLSMSPVIGNFRIGVIREAERLSVPAAHALLKLLEEPASRAKIFLLTSDSSQLLTTIQSRCVTVRLNSVPTSVLQEYAESMGVEHHKAGSLSRWSFGCPGKLISYLHNQAEFDTIVRSHNQAFELLCAPLWQRLAYLNADEAPYDILASALPVVLRDLAYLQANRPESVIMHEQIDALRHLASKKTSTQIVTALSELGEYHQARQSNISPQLFLENILLNV